ERLAALPDQAWPVRRGDPAQLADAPLPEQSIGVAMDGKRPGAQAGCLFHVVLAEFLQVSLQASEPLAHGCELLSQRGFQGRQISTALPPTDSMLSVGALPIEEMHRPIVGVHPNMLGVQVAMHEP